MIPLPKVMVAPNGARLGKKDHPNIPISIEEIVETAIACKRAGADGLHAHVRDQNGEHVLDAGLYRELLVECERHLPGFFVQITTEAIGRYSPQEQVNLAQEIRPNQVSVSFSELARFTDKRKQVGFYRWAQENNVQIQHILYGAGDLTALMEMERNENIYCNKLQVLFVLGRYSRGQISTPSMLNPFLDELKKEFSGANNYVPEWAVCAFGKSETKCLQYGFQAGGSVRVGFENNIFNSNGDLAEDNAERVAAVVAAIKSV